MPLHRETSLTNSRRLKTERRLIKKKTTTTTSFFETTPPRRRRQRRKRFVFDPFCNDFEERGHLHNNDGFRAFKEEKTKIARNNGVEVVRQCDASLQLLSKDEGTKTKIKHKKKRIFLGFQKLKKKKKKKERRNLRPKKRHLWYYYYYYEMSISTVSLCCSVSTYYYL